MNGLKKALGLEFRRQVWPLVYIQENYSVKLNYTVVPVRAFIALWKINTSGEIDKLFVWRKLCHFP